MVEVHLLGLDLLLTDLDSELRLEDIIALEALELDLADKLITILASLVGDLLSDLVTVLECPALSALVLKQQDNLVIHRGADVIRQVLVLRQQEVAVFKILDLLLVGRTARVQV